MPLELCGSPFGSTPSQNKEAKRKTTGQALNEPIAMMATRSKIIEPEEDANEPNDHHETPDARRSKTARSGRGKTKRSEDENVDESNERCANNKICRDEVVTVDG